MVLRFCRLVPEQVGSGEVSHSLFTEAWKLTAWFFFQNSTYIVLTGAASEVPFFTDLGQ